jgi:hypothetical protein
MRQLTPCPERGGRFVENIPLQLLQGLPPDTQQAVVSWWSSLTEDNRRMVATLCDERQEKCFFGLIPVDADREAPVVLGGRFVPHDDAAGWAEWHAEYFDHLLNNPELVLVDAPVVRTFHICTAHTAAREALAAGRIPADFFCPLGSPDCPLRRLLGVAPGKSLQFTGTGVPSRRT